VVAVLSMSKQEFSRLDVLLRVQSGGLRVSDACALIGLQRRQVFVCCVASSRTVRRACCPNTGASPATIGSPLRFAPWRCRSCASWSVSGSAFRPAVSARAPKSPPG
jgi:hypothetical protein